MRRCLLLGLFVLLAPAPAGSAEDTAVVAVEPADLVRKPELIGRTVVVDDRVRFFQSHPGQGYDELFLKRTPIVFRLPPRLRPEVPPRQTGVRVQGTLVREGDRWACEVLTLELLPSDLARVDQAVAALPKGDYQGRLSWSRWAERRGKDFRDDALLDRARELEVEAFRIEAERPSADPAKHWLALAERARDRRFPTAEYASLAHRALRLSLAGAKGSDAVAPVVAQVESFFPDAPRNQGNPAEAAKLQAAYAKDPAGAYRSATPAARAALDHQLWADALQRQLELKLAEDPQDAMALAEKAGAQLPDRPEVATRLLETGLRLATRDVGQLRLNDVQALAAAYRDKLKQPERARELLRDWLSDQRRNRLGRTDAEGRVALAGQYESLIGDEATAVALLREAWALDPESKEIADVFRRKGFRKIKGEWVEPRKEPSGEAKDPAGGSSAPPERRDNSLRNLTPEEVRGRLGAKPSRIVRSASQGQVTEQWIYEAGKDVIYINFRYGTDLSRPTVVSYYTDRGALSRRPLP